MLVQIWDILPPCGKDYDFSKTLGYFAVVSEATELEKQILGFLIEDFPAFENPKQSFPNAKQVIFVP